LGEDFGLALCSDFFRDFLVVSSSAFFNAVPRMIQFGDLVRRTSRMGMAVPCTSVGNLRG